MWIKLVANQLVLHHISLWGLRKCHDFQGYASQAGIRLPRTLSSPYSEFRAALSTAAVTSQSPGLIFLIPPFLCQGKVAGRERRNSKQGLLSQFPCCWTHKTFRDVASGTVTRDPGGILRERELPLKWWGRFSFHQKSPESCSLGVQQSWESWGLEPSSHPT